MLADLAPLWLAALPLMGSPGPTTLSTAAVGASFGWRRGLPWLAGIVAGTAVVLLLIASGVTAALLAVPALKAAITLLAGGYILWLAWRIATAPPLSNDITAKAPAFPGGFLLAVANPKAFAAIGAVYAGHSVVPGDLATDAALKIAALVPVIVLVNAVWLLSGTLLAKALRDPKKSRIANVGFAVLLVGSVVSAVM